MKTIDDLLAGTKYTEEIRIQIGNTNQAFSQDELMRYDAKANAALAAQLPKAVEALEEVYAFVRQVESEAKMVIYMNTNRKAEAERLLNLLNRTSDTLTTIREAQAIVEAGK